MKVIAVKESIFSNNDKVADELRASLRKKGAFMINVMSSPGQHATRDTNLLQGKQQRTTKRTVKLSFFLAES